MLIRYCSLFNNTTFFYKDIPNKILTLEYIRHHSNYCRRSFSHITLPVFPNDPPPVSGIAEVFEHISNGNAVKERVIPDND